MLCGGHGLWLWFVVLMEFNDALSLGWIVIDIHLLISKHTGFGYLNTLFRHILEYMDDW